MKHLITISLSFFLLMPCFADVYTIKLKDSGTASDKTQELKSSNIEDYLVIGEDYVTSLETSKCYYAKEGYGLKLGTTAESGRITIRLDETYYPNNVVVTAAAYNTSEASKGFMLNDITISKFSQDIELYDYEIVLDGQTPIDSLYIHGTSTKNNRFYITKIQIDAPNPNPDKPILKGPKLSDWGFEHKIDGLVETSMDIDIVTQNLVGDINLSLKDGKYFHLLSETMPAEGGTVSLTFSHTVKGTYSDTLFLNATSKTQAQVTTSVPMTIRVLDEIFHSGEIDDPYTVSDAIAQTEELADNETSSKSWYIIGEVTADEITVSNTNGGLNLYIKDNANTIYVYSLSGEGGTTLSASDIRAGDTLLIKSRLQNYVSWQSSNKELYLGELINSDIPVIDWRQVQEGYYDDIQDLSNASLMHTLGNIVSGGTRYTYGSGAHHTWDAFYYTDRDENSMLVLDMYSDNQRFFNQDKPNASVANLDIEHMFPKSWWGGTVNNAYKDLNHLVPADYSANRSKGNDAPGKVMTASFDNDVFKIGVPAADCPAPRVFEPSDEYKGDFARAYFYIITAYSDLDWDIKNSPAQYALDPTNPLLLQPWLQNLLVEWHRMDPVSDKELRRQQQVSRIQHNRNPFIDYPCLVEYIWGDMQSESVDIKQLLFTSSSEYQTTNDKSGCTCECKEEENTAIYSPKQDTNSKIQLVNGTFLIIHNNMTYTITGQQIKK